LILANGLPEVQYAIISFSVSELFAKGGMLQNAGINIAYILGLLCPCLTKPGGATLPEAAADLKKTADEVKDAMASLEEGNLKWI